MKHLNDDAASPDGMWRVPLKAWLRVMGRRLGLRANCLSMRIQRGSHPKPPMERLNARRVFVLVPASVAEDFGPDAIAELPVTKSSLGRSKKTLAEMRCLCGNVAAAMRFNMPVCARCLAIEERLDADFHRDKPVDPLKKYFKVYSVGA